MTALPPSAAAAVGGAAQWRQLTTALLTLSSLAAAATWLGYVPAQLLTAAAEKLGAAEPAVLQAAGLEAAAQAVQQQAAAAVMARGEDSSSVGSSGSSPDAGTAVQWYCLEEKLQLYSSVLRLLTCAFIEPSPEARQQPHETRADAAAQRPAGTAPEPGTPATSVPDAGLRATLPASPALAEAAASVSDARPVGGLAAAGSAELARQQALALLRGQQAGRPLSSIRWAFPPVAQPSAAPCRTLLQAWLGRTCLPCAQRCCRPLNALYTLYSPFLIYTLKS